jgi:hypothetical protein
MDGMARGTRTLGRSAFALLGAAALLAAGCGGGSNKEKSGGGGETAKRLGAPKPQRSLQSILPGLVKAMGSHDCRVVSKYFDIKSLKLDPNQPVSKERCGRFTAIGDTIEGMRVLTKAEYGTAAHVTAINSRTTAGQVINLTFVLDQDGQWKMLHAARGAPQAHTGPKPGVKFDEHMRQWVAAARKHDCDALWRLDEATGRFVTQADGQKSRYCKAVNDAYTRPEGGFLRDLSDEKDVQPHPLGGSFVEQFYGFSFKNGRYVTLVIALTPTLASKAERKGHESPGVDDYIGARAPERRPVEQETQ